MPNVGIELVKLRVACSTKTGRYPGLVILKFRAMVAMLFKI